MKRIILLSLLLLLVLPSVAAAQDDSVTVTLSEQNDSGISGTATLTQVGDDLRVVIDVSGSPADGDHPAHIHSGACPNPGGVVHPLENVVDGESTTVLDGVSLASVADGNHAVNVHESPANTQLYVACGNIPEVMADAGDATATTDTMAGATATPMAAAGATSTAAVAGLPATGGGGSAGTTPWAAIIVTLAATLALVGLSTRKVAATSR